MRIIEKLLVILCIYNFIYILSHIVKLVRDANSESNSIQVNSKKTHSICYIIVLILVVISVVLLILFFAKSMVGMMQNGVVSILLAVLAYLGMIRFINMAINAWLPVKEYLFDRDVCSKFSWRESALFFNLCISLLLLTRVIPFSVVISWIKVNVELEIIKEAILSMSYLATISFTIFLLFGLSIVPIKHLEKGMQTILFKYGSIWGKIQKEDTVKYSESIDARLVERKASEIKERDGFKKIVSVVSIFPCIIGSSTWSLLRLFGALLYNIWIREFLIFVGYGFKVLLYFIKRIADASRKSLMRNIFKASIIIATAIVVVANRLSLWINTDEVFEDIFEFIASAIIIPIVIEWIYSSKVKAMKP